MDTTTYTRTLADILYADITGTSSMREDERAVARALSQRQNTFDAVPFYTAEAEQAVLLYKPVYMDPREKDGINPLQVRKVLSEWGVWQSHQMMVFQHFLAEKKREKESGTLAEGLLAFSLDAETVCANLDAIDALLQKEAASFMAQLVLVIRQSPVFLRRYEDWSVLWHWQKNGLTFALRGFSPEKTGKNAWLMRFLEPAYLILETDELALLETPEGVCYWSDAEAAIERYGVKHLFVASDVLG